MRRDDIFARILGIFVFLGGVGLLAFVFYVAYDWFVTPSAGIQMSASKGASAPPATLLGASALQLLIKLALLLIMTIVGSLLAGKGIHIYFASSGRRPSIAVKDE